MPLPVPVIVGAVATLAVCVLVATQSLILNSPAGGWVYGYHQALSVGVAMLLGTIFCWAILATSFAIVFASIMGWGLSLAPPPAGLVYRLFTFEKKTNPVTPGVV